MSDELKEKVEEHVEVKRLLCLVPLAKASQFKDEVIAELRKIGPEVSEEQVVDAVIAVGKRWNLTK